MKQHRGKEQRGSRGGMDFWGSEIMGAIIC